MRRLRTLSRRQFGGLLMAGATAPLAGCLNTPYQRPIPSTSYEGRTRVACVGDSITAGAGLPHPELEAYPAVLGELLGFAYHVRNFGVSGATMLRDGDLPYAGTGQFQEAREFRPHLVVIALGTNDSKPQNWRFETTLERDTFAMMRAFLTLPTAPLVYLCTPPPVFTDRWGINEAIVGKQIRPRYRDYSARQGWPLIDLHSALADAGPHFPDGVHPDAVGATILARAVETAFRLVRE